MRRPLFNNPRTLILRGEMTERMTPPTDDAARTTQPSEYAAPTGWDKAGVFFRRLGPAGPLALLAATFPPLGGFVLIGFISKIAPWLREHPTQGLVIYVGGFSTLAAL